MNFQQMCAWNCEGWLWAPKESFDEFLLRRENCLSIEFPDKKEISSPLWDIQSGKFCCIEDNASLWPWQGAVLWEYQDQGIKYPVIQIRKTIPNFWKGSYTKQELIEHELVHALRFAYKEPFFEEVLAYRTSFKRWRRFLGPLFIYPWEATLLLSVSLGSIFVSLIQGSLLGVWIVLGLSVIFFLRLLVLQALFALCKRNLEKVGCGSQHSLPVMLRLSDREILTIALGSPLKNRKYFEKEGKLKTRISILVRLYFNNLEKNGCTFE